MLISVASCLRGGIPGAGGDKKKAADTADEKPKNQFPEGKVDTATGIFQKFARRDLLDSIEDTLNHLEDKLTSVETRFKTKLEAVENLASKEVRKVLDGIKSETERLGI